MGSEGEHGRCCSALSVKPRSSDATGGEKASHSQLLLGWDLPHIYIGPFDSPISHFPFCPVDIYYRLQGNFDEAQRLNTSARIVLEFTARCCGSAAPPEVSTTSKDNSRGAAAQGDGEALTSPAETQVSGGNGSYFILV